MEWADYLKQLASERQDGKDTMFLAASMPDRGKSSIGLKALAQQMQERFPLGVVKVVATVEEPTLKSREGLDLGTSRDYVFHRGTAMTFGVATPVTERCDGCGIHFMDLHSTNYGVLCGGCFINTVQSVVGDLVPSPAVNHYPILLSSTTPKYKWVNSGPNIEDL